MGQALSAPLPLTVLVAHPQLSTNSSSGRRWNTVHSALDRGATHALLQSYIVISASHRAGGFIELESCWPWRSGCISTLKRQEWQGTKDSPGFPLGCQRKCPPGSCFHPLHLAHFLAALWLSAGGQWPPFRKVDVFPWILVYRNCMDSQSPHFLATLCGQSSGLWLRVVCTMTKWMEFIPPVAWA